METLKNSTNTETFYNNPHIHPPFWRTTIKDDNGKDKVVFLGGFTAYTILLALARYGNGHIQSLAIQYLTPCDEETSAKRYEWSKSEGGFMSACFRGDILDALKRGGDSQYKAIATAILNKELDF